MKKTIGKTNFAGKRFFELPESNKKAYVITTTTGYKYLQSYETIVAVISPKGKFYRTWGGYSVTTKNHVNAFCYMYDLPGYNKKEWKNLPVYHSALRPYPCIYEEYNSPYNFVGYLAKFKFLGGV